MIKRVELLIYFNYRSDTSTYLKSLNLTIQYINKKMGYAVCYLDEESLKSTTEKIKRMRGFKKYEISPSVLVDLPI
ncbi:MAG: DUF2129 domain-containing protein [Bacillales bacterium]|nr:DUF2129 domain-containing protein [Bacillales bacterium]